MIEVLRSTRPYLDECGFVYVAGGGPDQECLRLNRTASQIWRKALGRATRSEVAALQESHRQFLAGLLSRGVLTFAPPAEGSCA